MNGIQKTIKIFAVFLAVMIILSIIRIALFGLSFVTDFDFNISNNISGESFTEVYQDVQKIDIDTSSSNIIIKVGDQFKVDASNVKSSFSSKLNNGTLKIKDRKKLFYNNNSTKIIVYIPEGINLNELEIDSGAGKIEINNVFINKFNINHGAGLLIISNSQFNNINIDGGVGEIKILSSILNNLDLDAGLGAINVEAKITGDSKIECGIGQIKLLLKGDESLYSITTKKGVGSIKINNEKQSNNQVYGNGINKLEVEGGIGEINVNFNH